MNNEEKREIVVPIRWQDISAGEAVYANQLLVIHTANEFFLYFGQAVPPAGLDPKNPPSEIDIRTVAKIAVNPEALMAMANAISQNIQKFKARNPGEEKPSMEFVQ